jgi:hypothetical protein
MVKIAEKLIDYGMEFTYENFGSQGEKIISFYMGLEISFQNGYIYYSIADQPQKIEDNEINRIKVLQLTEEACIFETT